MISTNHIVQLGSHDITDAPMRRACPLSCFSTLLILETCSIANLNMTSFIGALVIWLYSSR